MPDARTALAAILLNAIEDAVRGTPDNWEKIKDGLDALYVGNILTERIADHVVGKFKDEYAQAVKVGHAKMREYQAKGEV
jgi:hypothetical protein